MSAPILRGDTLVGVVTLYALRHEAFTRRHTEIIEGVASHLAPILRRRKSVGQASRLLLDGQLAAPHLDQYLRQFLDGRPTRSLFLLALRVSASLENRRWTLSQVVGEVYSNLRGGDLVFVCDEHTLVCLIADGDGVSATSAGERVVNASSERPGRGYRLKWCDAGRRFDACVIARPRRT